MSSFLVFSVLNALPPRGNVGVWVYDHLQAEPPAQWATSLESFNAAATGEGRIVRDQRPFPDML